MVSFDSYHTWKDIIKILIGDWAIVVVLIVRFFSVSKKKY